jgi:predicted ATPase/class 3 adenylate cyclase
MPSYEGFEIKDVVHRGARSTVLRAVRRADDVPVVLKHPTTDVPSAGTLRRLRYELDVGARLATRSGLPYLGEHRFGTSAAIVMEDLGAVDLERRFGNTRVPLAEWLVLARKIALALADLHALGFAHGDVKPANVLSTVYGRVMLCDFGNSLTLGASRRFASLGGTLAYIPPEQTGRTDRDLDHRADLYSLGATLFQLLVGRLPFEYDDPLALLHAHLARKAPLASSIARGVPAPVDALLDRLLAKDPRDRYQSAEGVAFDLEQITRALDTPGDALDRIVLGTRDVSSALPLEERLVGRDVELLVLSTAFERLVPGTPEFVFVRGPSGIGKTALVRELAPRFASLRAHVSFGKFEGQKRRVPLLAIFEALRSRMRALLSEPEEQLAKYRVRISEAIGANGALLAERVPELRALLPEMQGVPEVSPDEEQARFGQLAQAFLSALSTQSEPLVLFLDDLQWADDASLRWLSALAGSGTAHVLVIGAYRENEVDAAHPLSSTLATIRTRARVSEVSVGPLEEADTLALVSGWLGRRDAAVAKLAAGLHALTHGSPFYLRQLIATLHREGVVHFDSASMRFEWDDAAIEARGYSDNVVEFMVHALTQLPEDTRGLLAVASIVGTRFQLSTVAALASVDVDTVDTGLELPRLRRFVGPDSDDEDGYRFTHDRVQEAAYALMPRDQRTALHLSAARMLMSTELPDARVFEAIRHFDEAQALIEDESERAQWADLALRAARLAKTAGAWETARHHVGMAASLLGPALHTRDFTRFRAITEELAETSYLLGEYAATDAAIDALLTHARTIEDRAAAYVLRPVSLLARNELGGSLSAAKLILRNVGVKLPARAKTGHILRGLAVTKWRLRNATPASMMALPDASSTEMQIALQILTGISGTSFLAEPELYPLITVEGIRLTLQHGVSEGSAECFAGFAAVLVSGLFDVPGGRRVVDLAKALLLGPGRAQRVHRVLAAEAIFVLPWERPLGESVEALFDAQRAANEQGDTQYAAIAGPAGCFHALVAGQELEALEAVLNRQLAASERTRHRYSEGDIRRQLAFVRCLRGTSASPTRMVGPGYDEDADSHEQETAGAKNSASALAWYQGRLALTFGNRERAKERAIRAMLDVGAHQGTQLTPQIWFLHAIAHLRFDELGVSQKALALLRGMERAVPTSFGHLADLVAAERARVKSNANEAARFYELAVRRAQAAGMPQDAALAAELAAEFWRQREVPTVATGYLERARSYYAAWGAGAKVAALDPHFADRLPSETTSTSSGSITTTGSSSRFDLDAVVRASNAIASERTVEGVVRNVLLALIGDAGAERAVLLRAAGSGDLAVIAEATSARGEVVILDVPLDAYPDVPAKIVRYVERSGSAVVLRNAAVTGEFTRDPYVIRRRSRSLVCAPITDKSVLVGIVVLENDLAEASFTAGRLDVITMLAAQAAVSIANAELYQTLEDRVRERTEALEVRNAFIRQIFGRYLSNEVVDSLLERSEGLAFGGQRREVTIVFSDLRGFSTLTDELEPEQVVRLLNNYLSVMTDIIQRHHGTIDEILGDAILCIFGAPLRRADDAERAITCALEMQQAMEQVNAWNRAQGLPEVEMGIGMHTGDAIVGNIGSEKRSKYGVVGTPVNIASRIESFTLGGQVLASGATVAAVRSPLHVTNELTVHPKGSPDPIRLVEISGIDGATPIRIEPVSLPLLPLRAPLTVRCAIVERKSISEQRFEVEIIAASAKGAELRSAVAIPLMTDLMVRFDDASSRVADAFAKVVGPGSGAGTYVVRFTTLSPTGRALLLGGVAP